MDGEQQMREELARLFHEAWENHRGCVFGASLGIFVSVSILLFGFWNMMFIGFCVVVGLWLGKRIDDGDDVWLMKLRETRIGDLFRWQQKR